MLALDYPPETGGIQRYCYELAAALHRRGETIMVLASAQPGGEEWDARQDFPCRRVTVTSRTQAATALVSAVEQVLAEDALGEPVEAILCGKWFPEGAASLLLKRRRGLPYAVIGHGRETTLTGGNLMKWMMQRSVLRGAAGGLANSHYTAGQLARRGVPRERLALILAAVAPEEFRPDPAAVVALRERLGLGEEQVLLTVSRLVSRKGQAQVLQALPRIREQVGPVRYLIVGEGPEAEPLQRLTAQLGLEDEVRFLTGVPDGDLPALYALADVFVMPSRDLPGEPIEGFGLVYLEAALCGTPSIGGTTGGTADAILDGETGLLVDPEKPEEIAAACVRLLQDPALAARMAAAGRERILRELTWDHVAQRTIRALADWGRHE
jgi:phosphatidylinositol alpha-1,6-mannosyltransferase